MLNEFIPETQEWSNSQPRFDLREESSGLEAYVKRGTDQLKNLTQDHAARTVLMAMAGGLGVGVLIGKSMGRSSTGRSWWDRTAAENVGQRLIDQVQQVSPDAIKTFFKR